MEQKRANVSHCGSGSLNEGTKKIHNFILNSLQFSESFQKHTVIWIFFQLVLTGYKKEKKKERKENKRKERNVKTAITLCLNALCVLCSIIISYTAQT